MLNILKQVVTDNVCQIVWVIVTHIVNGSMNITHCHIIDGNLYIKGYFILKERNSSINVESIVIMFTRKFVYGLVKYVVNHRRMVININWRHMNHFVFQNGCSCLNRVVINCLILVLIRCVNVKNVTQNMHLKSQCLEINFLFRTVLG